MHAPDLTRRFVRYAHYTLGKAGDAGVNLTMASALRVLQ